MKVLKILILILLIVTGVDIWFLFEGTDEGFFIAHGVGCLLLILILNSLGRTKNRLKW